MKRNNTTQPTALKLRPSPCCEAESHVRRILDGNSLAICRCSACGELWQQEISRAVLVWVNPEPEVVRERRPPVKLRLVPPLAQA